MQNNYSVLDLFCGCGGLSLGFEMAGFEVKLAIDNWEDALVTYRKNHKGVRTVNGDLLTLKPEDLEKKIGIHGISVIIGGPPCQGFSVAGKLPQSEYQKQIRKNSTRLYNHQIVVQTSETQRIIAMVSGVGNYKCLPKEMWSLRKVHIGDKGSLLGQVRNAVPPFTVRTFLHKGYIENTVTILAA